MKLGYSSKTGKIHLVRVAPSGRLVPACSSKNNGTELTQNETILNLLGNCLTCAKCKAAANE